MNIQANSLQNMNGFTNNKPTITNVSETMSQAKDKMASVSRGEYVNSGAIYTPGTITYNSPAVMDTFITVGNSALMGNDQSAMANLRTLETDSELRSTLAKSVELFLFEGADEQNSGNTITDMANKLQSKLDELDNDSRLTDKERALLRSVWEEGFTNAVAFHVGTVEFGEAENAGVRTLEDAERFVRNKAEDISSSELSPEIQNLLLKGMDKMIDAPTFKHFLIKQHPIGIKFGPGDYRDFQPYIPTPKSSDIALFRGIIETTRNEMNNR